MTKPRFSAPARCLAVTALCFAAVAIAGAHPALAETVPPPGARFMTPGELHEIYHDKSWQWPDGAARMDSDARRFTAWSGSGKKAAWAEGRWSLRSRGRLCFEAEWHSGTQAHPARTCFQHKRDGRVFYQRKLPSGEWYVFKHAKTRSDDEFNKLVPRDLVSGRLETIRRAEEDGETASAEATTESPIIRRIGKSLSQAIAASMSSLSNPAAAASARGGSAGEDTIAPASEPIDKRPGITGKSVRFGTYDPHGDFSSDTNVEIEHLFLPWEDVDLSTLSLADDYASERGRALMITIEPWSWSVEWRLSSEELLAGILAGRYDTNMAAVCGAASMLESPVIIRWAQEMDETDNQFSWAHWKPEDFVAAYRRVVSVCRKQLPDATYMWSPKGTETLADFYPGDEFVDVIGLSVFGFQGYDVATFGKERSFAEALEPGYRRAARFGKPIIVAELGYEGDEAYVRDWAAKAAGPHPAFPKLKAIVYFNDREVYAWPDGFGYPNWRVTGPDELPTEGKRVSAE